MAIRAAMLPEMVMCIVDDDMSLGPAVSEGINTGAWQSFQRSVLRFRRYVEPPSCQVNNRIGLVEPNV